MAQSSSPSNSPSKHLQVQSLFSDPDAAIQVQTALKEAGIATENISVHSQAAEAKSLLRQNRAQSGVRGGAIAGSMFGLTVGLLLTVGTTDLSAASTPVGGVPPIVSAIGLALLASLLGALAGGAIGGISGANTPDAARALTDEELTEQTSHVNTYQVTVRGDEADIEKARAVFEQQHQR